MSEGTFLIAITGAMGAGKSAFSKVLKSLGIAVLDCDEIAKSVLFNDKLAQSEIRELLGSDCFDENSIPIPSKIAQKVFNDDKLLSEYEKIIHPKARILWESMAQKFRVCAIEVPLLFEKNLDKNFDLTVCVFVSESLRKARLVERGMSLGEIARRDFYQMGQPEKISKCDVAIFNEGSLDFLKMQAEILLKNLKITL